VRAKKNWGSVKSAIKKGDFEQSVRHVVLLKFKEDMSAEEKAAAAAKITAVLQLLPDEIEQVKNTHQESLRIPAVNSSSTL